MCKECSSKLGYCYYLGNVICLSLQQSLDFNNKVSLINYKNA